MQIVKISNKCPCPDWGWLLMFGDGTWKIITPDSHKTIRISLMYKANVILRWHWDEEDMWVAKNRWGRYECWLSETVITEAAWEDV
jgi:hypothetical protein